jgi:preprotein translocase subunit YajC
MDKKNTVKETFKVGDRVIAFGVKGTVREVTDDTMSVYVVYDESDCYDHFTKDGYWETWHHEPSLRLLK